MAIQSDLCPTRPVNLLIVLHLGKFVKTILLQKLSYMIIVWSQRCLCLNNFYGSLFNHPNRSFFVNHGHILISHDLCETVLIYVNWSVSYDLFPCSLPGFHTADIAEATDTSQSHISRYLCHTFRMTKLKGVLFFYESQISALTQS